MIQQKIRVKNLSQTIRFPGDASKQWYVEVIDSNFPAPVIGRIGNGTMDLVWQPRCLNAEIDVIFHTAEETSAVEEVSRLMRLKIATFKWTKAIMMSFLIIGAVGLILGILALMGIKQPHQLWEKVPTIFGVSEEVQKSSGFKTVFNSHEFFNSEVSWKYTEKNAGQRLKDKFQWVGEYNGKDLFIGKHLQILAMYDMVSEHCDSFPLARIPTYDELKFVSENWTANWKIDSLGSEWTSDKRFLWGNYKIFVPKDKTGELMALVSRIEESEGDQLDRIAAELGLAPRSGQKDSKFKRVITETAMMSKTAMVHHKAWFEDGVFWLNADDTLQGRCVITIDEDDWR